MPAELTRDSWFLTGPTAGGKTAVGIELARRLDAEILSLDSMAVYRGLDIGTAKPTHAERAALPHHLLDLVEPAQDYSVAQYLAAAESAVAALASRGCQPLFVGGTPLYLKALLRGIFQGPPGDWDFRRACQERVAREGAAALHAQLAEVDPPSARRLHQRDIRRIIRALEVWTKTGRPMSAWQQQFDVARPAEACRVFVLDWPRDLLYQRIESRVDAMFSAGLVDEVRNLRASGQSLGRTASQALGYREVLSHLQGDVDLATTIALVKTRTRQFAKRQLTWFRSLSEGRWVSVTEPFDPLAIAAQIAGLAGS